MGKLRCSVLSSEKIICKSVFVDWNKCTQYSIHAHAPCAFLNIHIANYYYADEFETVVDLLSQTFLNTIPNEFELFAHEMNTIN